MPRNGSAISWQMALFPPEMSTSGISGTCSPPTSISTGSATFSPGSEAGPSHSGGQDGQAIGRSGPDPAPVNLSARQAAAAGLLTSGISGPHGPGSSASHDLTWSLGNRLMGELQGCGSMLFRLTWSVRDTPSGRPYFRLQASARRTRGTEISGWPTATAQDGNRGRRPPRPWDTGLPLDQAAALAAWPTSRATDSTGGLVSRSETGGLNDAVLLAIVPDQPARITADGTVLTGSSAAMPSGGQLSPEHSRWLMGFPAGWGSCGAMATRLSRRSPRRSCKRR